MSLPRPVPGLSPRVRGNQDLDELAASRAGSIPAGAGEPLARTTSPGRERVYPRGCGGTVECVVWASAPTWSIPAGAGEPELLASRDAVQGVYPRGCGGTGPNADTRPSVPGLSPRVRGNLLLQELHLVGEGSIPAGAGEPRAWCAASGMRRVYPRGCGGTPINAILCASSRGLSPRVRGNPAECLLP